MYCATFHYNRGHALLWSRRPGRLAHACHWRGALPCACSRFCRSSHDHETKITTPSAQALLFHLDYFFSTNSSITALRFLRQLAPAFHSSLRMHIFVTLTDLPSALRRPGNVHKVIIPIAPRGRILRLESNPDPSHRVDAYSTWSANAFIAEAQFSAR